MNKEHDYKLNNYSSIGINPEVSLQMEQDNWGLLYNPANDSTMGINPESIFLWKQLETGTTIKHLTCKIKETYTGVPYDIEEKITEVINNFINGGFAIIQGEDNTEQRGEI